ncbi:MAG: M23 family metallopeptidase [Clostridia bacterium]|nr:M23 family metallopeptidase [Clostridia bacterium]
MKEEKTKSKKRVLYYSILTVCVLLLAAAIVLTVYFVTGRSGEVIDAPDPSGPTEPDKPDVPDDKPTGGDDVDPNPYVIPISATYNFEYGEIYENQTIGCIYRHYAIDFSADEGTDVFAMADGTVTEVNYHESLGNRITVDHGNGLTSVYIYVTPVAGLGVGQKVTKGEKIAEVGAEGSEMKDGAHLHFEVKENNKWVDPNKYIDAVLDQK